MGSVGPPWHASGVLLWHSRSPLYMITRPGHVLPSGCTSSVWQADATSAAVMIAKYKPYRFIELPDEKYKISHHDITPMKQYFQVFGAAGRIVWRGLCAWRIRPAHAPMPAAYGA